MRTALYFRLVGRCTRADAAALLAALLERGLLSTLLAIVPTRGDVTSFLAIELFSSSLV